MRTPGIVVAMVAIQCDRHCLLHCPCRVHDRTTINVLVFLRVFDRRLCVFWRLRRRPTCVCITSAIVCISRSFLVRVVFFGPNFFSFVCTRAALCASFSFLLCENSHLNLCDCVVSMPLSLVARLFDKACLSSSSFFSFSSLVRGRAPHRPQIFRQIKCAHVVDLGTREMHSLATGF